MVLDVAMTLTISDAARASGVSAHTLRYYERAGLLDPVDRARSGHRRYAEDDLARIQFLTKLRSTGMPIRQIRQYADLVRRGEDTQEARMAMLVAHRDAVREQLEETARHLDLIERKIDFYRERCCPG
jgi:DNA-binding transcriptional MerR regulator